MMGGIESGGKHIFKDSFLADQALEKVDSILLFIRLLGHLINLIISQIVNNRYSLDFVNVLAFG